MKNSRSRKNKRSSVAAGEQKQQQKSRVRAMRIAIVCLFFRGRDVVVFFKCKIDVFVVISKISCCDVHSCCDVAMLGEHTHASVKKVKKKSKKKFTHAPAHEISSYSNALVKQNARSRAAAASLVVLSFLFSFGAGVQEKDKNDENDDDDDESSGRQKSKSKKTSRATKTL